MKHIENYNVYTWKFVRYQVDWFWEPSTTRWFRVIQNQEWRYIYTPLLPHDTNLHWVILDQGGSSANNARSSDNNARSSDSNDPPSEDNDECMKLIWGFRDSIEDEEDMIP